MVKIVALQNTATRLAALLQERGYKVTDLHAASLPHAHIDAVLYNSNHPAVPAPTGSADMADISLGGHTAAIPGELPSAIMLNVAGLHPEQALALLEHRLGQSGRR